MIRAIRQVRLEDKKSKAVEIGKRVREEKGLQAAVDLIEKYMSSAPVYN